MCTSMKRLTIGKCSMMKIIAHARRKQIWNGITAQSARMFLGTPTSPPPPLAARYPTSRMLLLFFWPFWSRYRWVLTFRLQQLRLRMRHYCMLLYCLHHGSRIRNLLWAWFPKLTLRVTDFLQATKCAFLQPQLKSCGWQLSYPRFLLA